MGSGAAASAPAHEFLSARAAAALRPALPYGSAFIELKARGLWCVHAAWW